MEKDDLCTLRLGRGLGGGGRFNDEHMNYMNTNKPLQITLLPLGGKEVEVEAEDNSQRLKRSSQMIGDTECNQIEIDDASSVSRKKLKLSEAQFRMLEDRFSADIYLSAREKQELGEKLNLNPRQVHAWFKNRRARTKQKNTELECEYLKKCCERLYEENRRLERELKKFRAANPGLPFCYQLPMMPRTNPFHNFASKAEISLGPALNDPSSFRWAGEEVFESINPEGG